MLFGKDLSMTEEDEIKSSPVLDFYRDKVVLLTGGTGFIGKLLVQKLLRLNVKEVVFLSRPKKGKSNDERMDEIFSGVVFSKVKSCDKNFNRRVKIVDADLQKCDLGLSIPDQNYIIDNVQIVIHAAADVRFDQTLKKAIEVNVRGTRDLLRLMDKSKLMEVFVYVSTVYSNCPNKQIDEAFYPPPTDPEKSITLVENLDENYELEMNKITQDLIKPWPNTYVYTKCMTEEIVRRYSKRLPIAVVRPSIVIATVDDPIPGWTDNIYGLNGVIAGVALGIIRVMVIDDDIIGDIIPADFAVNTILTAAWNTVDEKQEEKMQLNGSGKSRDAKIYNCVSSPDNPIDWRDIYKFSIDAGKLIPARNAIWIVSWTTVTNLKLYAFLKFFYHLVPAYIADTYLKIIGKKPRLMKLYNKIHKFSEVITYFANSQWTFQNANTKALFKKLSPEDKELFQFDITKVNWREFWDVYMRGLRRYITNETETEANLREAREQYARRKIYHNLIKFTVIGLLLYFIYSTMTFLNLV